MNETPRSGRRGSRGHCRCFAPQHLRAPGRIRIGVLALRRAIWAVLKLVGKCVLAPGLLAWQPLL